MNYFVSNITKKEDTEVRDNINNLRDLLLDFITINYQTLEWKSSLLTFIVDYDDIKKVYVSKLESGNVQFIQYEKIRFIFSKLGRFINMHEVTHGEENQQQFSEKEARLIYSLYQISCKWKQDFEICNAMVYADTQQEHTNLCRQRFDKKTKTQQVDKGFLDISNEITQQIPLLKKMVVQYVSVMTPRVDMKRPLQSPLVSMGQSNNLKERLNQQESAQNKLASIAGMRRPVGTMGGLGGGMKGLSTIAEEAKNETPTSALLPKPNSRVVSSVLSGIAGLRNETQPLINTPNNQPKLPNTITPMSTQSPATQATTQATTPSSNPTTAQPKTPVSAIGSQRRAININKGLMGLENRPSGFAPIINSTPDQTQQKPTIEEKKPDASKNYFSSIMGVRKPDVPTLNPVDPRKALEEQRRKRLEEEIKKKEEDDKKKSINRLSQIRKDMKSVKDVPTSPYISSMKIVRSPQTPNQIAFQMTANVRQKEKERQKRKSKIESLRAVVKSQLVRKSPTKKEIVKERNVEEIQQDVQSMQSQNSSNLLNKLLSNLVTPQNQNDSRNIKTSKKSFTNDLFIKNKVDSLLLGPGPSKNQTPVSSIKTQSSINEKETRPQTAITMKVDRQHKIQVQDPIKASEKLKDLQSFPIIAKKQETKISPPQIDQSKNDKTNIQTAQVNIGILQSMKSFRSGDAKTTEKMFSKEPTRKKSQCQAQNQNASKMDPLLATPRQQQLEQKKKATSELDAYERLKFLSQQAFADNSKSGNEKIKKELEKLSKQPQYSEKFKEIAIRLLKQTTEKIEVLSQLDKVENNLLENHSKEKELKKPQVPSLLLQSPRIEPKGLQGRSIKTMGGMGGMGGILISASQKVNKEEEKKINEKLKQTNIVIKNLGGAESQNCELDVIQEEEDTPIHKQSEDFTQLKAEIQQLNHIQDHPSPHKPIQFYPENSFENSLPSNASSKRSSISISISDDEFNPNTSSPRKSQKSSQKSPRKDQNQNFTQVSLAKQNWIQSDGKKSGISQFARSPMNQTKNSTLGNVSRRSSVISSKGNLHKKPRQKTTSRRLSSVDLGTKEDFIKNIGKEPKKSQFHKFQQRDDNEVVKKQKRKLSLIENQFSEKEKDPRRTLSDFHEQMWVKQLVENKFQSVNSSVSDATHSFNFSNEDESDQESEVELVRFYSLKVLPSQEEILSTEALLKMSDNSSQPTVLDSKIKTKITISDFELVKALSHGAYGKVCLARKKLTRDLFAIKVLNKVLMKEKNAEEFVMKERDILAKVDNDWIVRGVYNFQTETYLYMVMEYMRGGDMLSLLNNFQSLEECYAKLYLSQMVLALEYLHSNNIVHRDLKPDNVLIDAEGKIKLTDFGLSEEQLNKRKSEVKQAPSSSKHNPESDSNRTNLEYYNENNQVGTRESIMGPAQKKNRMLGTPDYMAPEVILGKNHTHAVDWWAMGVITFEMITGVLPFHNTESAQKVFDNILQKKMTWPKIGREENEMTPECKDIIERWLEFDPEKRLGTQSVQEVKEHGFFKEINWDKVREEAPPFIPMVKNDTDTQYFREDKAQFKLDSLMEIQNEMNKVSANGNLQKPEDQSAYQDFDGTCVQTLQYMNDKEAQRALRIAKRQERKRNMVLPKTSQMISEDLLMVGSRLHIDHATHTAASPHNPQPPSRHRRNRTEHFTFK